MVTLHRFPSVSSITSHKLICSSPTYSSKAYCCRYQLRYSSVYASSSKKPRGNKKAKSNEDLCNEIREFLSSAGLPENHVPSLKELSQHDRKDLANIVRRRGYKLIRQLLEASAATNSNSSYIYTDKTVSEGQDEIPKVLPDVVSLDETVQETKFCYDLYTCKEPDPNGKSSYALESTTLSLEENVTEFFAQGELDTIEGSGLEIEHAAEGGWESGSNDAHNEWTSNDEDIKDETREMVNKDEIQHMEFILRQKELELRQLKRQIEKEELALSALETKAEMEINHIQALLSETDIDLKAAEESLSRLKQVEVQYSGDGTIVELAGSFNGWHHKIKMDLVSLLSATTPSQSRMSRLWTAVLWLYPGVYEIKFVVDGRWTIDPQRETVFRGFTHNNILRVH